MNIFEILASIGRLTKAFHVMEERFSRIDTEVKELRKELKESREQVAALTTRVSVLEEGRKTTAAEVKVAITETLARLEIAWLREDAKRQILEAAKKDDAA